MAENLFGDERIGEVGAAVGAAAGRAPGGPPVGPAPPTAPETAAPAPTCGAGQVVEAGACVDVATTLHGLRWEMPCKAHAAKADVCQAAKPRLELSATLGGAPAQAYDVTLRFRGVVEQQRFDRRGVHELASSGRLVPMQPSWSSVWFCAVVAALGGGVAFIHPSFGLLWILLWVGLAVFFVGARRRFPPFQLLSPPASLESLGMPDDALGGALQSPWYVLILVGTAWVCVAPVPLIARGTSLLGFGIGIAATLAGAAFWLRMRQRASARVAARLLATPTKDERRLAGLAQGDGPLLRRETFWFSIAGVNHGTAQVENIHGGTVTVATATPTSNTYGFVQERERAPLQLGVGADAATVESHGALWAAPVRALPRTPQLLPRPHARGGWSMGEHYIRSGHAWEREEIGAGDRVVVLGTWDATHRRLTSAGLRPVVLFGVPADRDPSATLRHELWQRRWPIAAQLVLAVIAVIISL